MSGELTVDELGGRGLEPIRNPGELANSLQAIIIATPDTVPKTKVLEIFEQEWNYVRGEDPTTPTATKRTEYHRPKGRQHS